MPFVEYRLKYGYTHDNGLVVTEHVCLGHDRNTEIAEHVSEINDCSVAVHAATNSEPYVAVSTEACIFKYQSIGVVLMEYNTTVADFHVTISWSKLSSRNVVVITLFPSSLGMSFGISSLTFP